MVWYKCKAALETEMGAFASRREEREVDLPRLARVCLISPPLPLGRAHDASRQLLFPEEELSESMTILPAQYASGIQSGWQAHVASVAAVQITRDYNKVLS